MKTRSLAPGAYLARSGQGVSLYDADGKCFAMNKMGGSILALALTGLSAEGIADAFLAVGHRHCCPMSAIAQKYAGFCD